MSRRYISKADKETVRIRANYCCEYCQSLEDRATVVALKLNRKGLVNLRMALTFWGVLHIRLSIAYKFYCLYEEDSYRK